MLACARFMRLLAIVLLWPLSAAGEVSGSEGFSFGSYGRIGTGSDLRGARGRSANIVSHGSRLEELPYVELDLYYGMHGAEMARTRVVLALALFGDFFHTTGRADEDWAVRNAYVETSGVSWPALTLWAGSRMLRGDDIYLLDFWPLDNLNTVGGGGALSLGTTTVSAHVGVTRLDNSYQFEAAKLPSAAGGAEEVVLLDRPRLIASGSAERRWHSLKVKLYGEAHRLPEGTAQVMDAADTEPREEELPSDIGWVLGSQVGLWDFAPRAFANVWLRAAGGLAAYGDNAVPFGIDDEKRVSDAREFLVALAANWEWWKLGVIFGGYAKFFKDADGNDIDTDDGWEWIAALRPHCFVTQTFAVASEVSFQERRPRGPSPVTGERETARVTRVSLMPLVSPLGMGTLTRPHLRLVYTASFRNDGAQHLLNASDPRATRNVEQYLGVQAEWWFDSSYR